MLKRIRVWATGVYGIDFVNGDFYGKIFYVNIMGSVDSLSFERNIDICLQIQLLQ